ncbi:MAG: acyl carrier protein [Moraxella sp.]|nr:acyl carrier protein [Moraxella sp.]
MSNDIEAKVKAAIAEKLNLDANELNNGASFEADLGADSLDLVEVMMECEKEFGISIPDTENLNTVQDVIDYISAKKLA